MHLTNSISPKTLDFSSHTLSLPPPESDPQIKQQSFLYKTINRLYSYLITTLKALSSAEGEPLRNSIVKLRPTVVQILLYLDRFPAASTSDGKALEKIRQISAEILTVKSSFDQMVGLSRRLLEKPPIDLKICVFLATNDSKDYNGAFSSRIIYCIKQQVPFITLRCMLRCTDFEDNREDTMEARAAKLENIFFHHEHAWAIFQQIHPDYGCELIICLPKTLLTQKTDQESLQALDFKADATLVRIPLCNALEGPEREFHIFSLYKLFTDTPRIHKIFYAFGHGDQTTFAGINRSQISTFFDFAEKQLCRALCMSSCNLGGEGSTGFTQKYPHKYPFIYPTKEERALPFLIMIRSIGGVPTYGRQKAEKNIKTLLDKLANYLLNHSATTLKNFRLMIEEIEGDAFKYFNNHIQIRFPHSRGIPAGFKPIDEHSRGYSLTFRRLKTAEIEKKLFITLSRVEFLELHTLVVSLPIHFTFNNSIPFSMIPGSSHHILKKFHLDPLLLESPEEYIASIIANHRNLEIESVNKSFFIEEIISGKNVLKNVVISLSSNGSIAIWKQDQSCYFSKNGYEKKTISLFSYDLLCFQILTASISAPKSVRTATGGQEDESFFLEAFHTAQFLSDRIFNSLFSTDDPNLQCDKLFAEISRQYFLSYADKKRIFRFRSTFQHTLKQSSFLLCGLFHKLGLSAFKEKISQGITKYGLSPEETAELLFFLLNYGYGSITPALFHLHHINPNSKNLVGTPLLCAAIQAQTFQLAQLLLACPNLDINQPTSQGCTPLLLAINWSQNLANDSFWGEIPCDKTSITTSPKTSAEEIGMILQTILAHPEVNMDLTDRHGWHALDYALPNIEMCKQLLQLKSSVTYRTSSLNYLLRISISRGYFSNIPELLKLKADPNQGSPSALVLAVYSNNPLLVKQLLEAGGDPLLADSGGKVPLIEALLRSYPIIVTQLLKNWLDSHRANRLLGKMALRALMTASDANDLTPPIAALLSGSSKKLTILRQLKAPFNISFNCNTKVRTDLIFRRWIRSNNLEAFIQILEWNRDNEVLEKNILSFLVKNNHLHFAKELISLNLIDVCKNQVFHQIIATHNLELVKLAIEKGASLNTGASQQWEVSPLQLAAEYITFPAGEEIFKCLIDQGANPHASGTYSYTPFYRLVQAGHFDLIKYCIDEKGLSCNFSSNRFPSILTVAAKLKNDPSGEIFKYFFFKSHQNINAYEENSLDSLFTILLEKANFELVQWALNQGANLNPTHPKLQRSPLQVVAGHKNDLGGKIFKGLLAAGADINLTGSLKEPPTLLIIEKGDFRLTQLCFVYGAKLNLEQQSRALTAAIHSGNPEIVEFLLAKGFQFSEAIVKNFSFYYRGYAAGGIEMLRLLLPFLETLLPCCQETDLLWEAIVKKGDVEAADMLLSFTAVPWISLDALTIQQLAIHFESLPFLQFLKNKYGSIDAKDVDISNLKKLIASGSYPIIEFLFNEGVNPHDFESQVSGNLLFVTALQQPTPNLNIIRLLLQYHISARHTVQGKPSIYYAVQHGDAELVKLLIDYGAASDIGLKYRKTHRNALQLALLLENEEIIEILESAVKEQF